ncbi:MAG: hypothetical protein RI883_200, partial [Bacteroidota bacterium]
MLKVQDLQLSFDRTILQNINFTVGEGEIIGIVGKSGAGKTSLLKIIAGLLDPTSGQVLFEDKKVIGPSVKLVPGHPEIQLVNQDFHLDSYFTVEENIREQILYLPRKQRDAFVEELLELIELTPIKSQKVNTLSGGELQRLAIAKALACEPKIVLLDEPFVHLDGRLRSKMINYLLELKKVRNTSFILVSHDGSEMLSLADRIFSMKKGVFTRKGKPLDFYYKPKSIEEAKLFGAINSVNIGGKRILFRPDQYEICKDENGFEVEFDHSLFTGPVYENYFTTKNKENIVLYSLN